MAAPGGGLSDLVREGETGAIVDPENAEVSAERIRELLQRDVRREAFAQNARRFAEGCDWTSETRALVEDYAQTITRLDARRSVRRRWRWSPVARRFGRSGMGSIG